MPRETKFRGYSKQQQKWFYGDLILPKKGNTRAWIVMYSQGFGGWLMVIQRVSVDPASVGQYTTLKDKNGTKIYDGDIIVKSDYPFYSEGQRNYVGLVEWVYGGWYYDIQRVSSRVRGAAVGGHIDDDGLGGSDFEVIGNIHENPELLEVKDA